MKKLRSYSSVWKVEQVIYSFGDAKLPTPVTVTQLLWLAASGVLAAMEQKELQFSVSCPETITLPHDRRWTAEALANLLDNAVKYTPAGAWKNGSRR